MGAGFALDVLRHPARERLGLARELSDRTHNCATSPEMTFLGGRESVFAPSTTPTDFTLLTLYDFSEESVGAARPMGPGWSFTLHSQESILKNICEDAGSSHDLAHLGPRPFSQPTSWAQPFARSPQLHRG